MKNLVWLLLYNGYENTSDEESEKPEPIECNSQHWFGPFKEIQITYGQHIKCYADTDDPHKQTHPLEFEYDDEFVVNDDVLYGDISITANEPSIITANRKEDLWFTDGKNCYFFPKGWCDEFECLDPMANEELGTAIYGYLPTHLTPNSPVQTMYFHLRNLDELHSITEAEARKLHPALGLHLDCINVFGVAPADDLTEERVRQLGVEYGALTDLFLNDNDELPSNYPTLYDAVPIVDILKYIPRSALNLEVQ